MTTFDSLIRMDSPIGRLEIVAQDGAIVGLDIEHNGHLRHEREPENESPVLKQAVRELREYFAGQRRKFAVPVKTSGTDFQQSVWRELLAIPYGAVRSYGEVGHATGRATAGRAVGGAVGANPIPLLIPCHRVLASDGRITGYSGGNGIPTKVQLLELEGIDHR